MDVFEMPGIGAVKVRRSANIKYLSVRIAPGRGVWVNVPYGVSGKQMRQFLEEKREWIVQHLAGIKAYEKKTGVGLGIGAEIPTKLHVLHVVEYDCVKPDYTLEGTKITLWIPRGTCYEKIDPIVRNFLLEIYKKECRTLLPERVKYLADRYGFRYRQLSFRNNISNWGSCSQDDKISLNIKLMKLPDALIDYVILHELCHTVEKNHSARFWALVGKVCPDYAVLRRKLKEYNTRL